jgi:DNA invertase Pin-like site-specific DNA recombinase
MRTACYARFSSDLQRETSLEDQIRGCREYVDCHGFTWQDDQTYTDAAVSGASIEGRAGLQALLAAAASSPRPFDVVLVDDSSRVARDLADALRVLQRLRFAGVRVVYISQGIDSASEQAETLIAVHGLVDGLYLREMAAKIRRGLAGQLERGFSTGGAQYGYRTVPVLDPSGRTESDGRPALLGKRLEVNEAEAAVIRRIFEWYASGIGIPTIVQRLNTDGTRGPRGATWKFGAVRRLLQNERLVGRQIWGQRRHERRPGSRQKVARVLPRSEWRIVDRRDLRIVSDDLWAAARARLELVGKAARQAGTTLMRGKNAALHSRHLFSGFMRCGVCGGSVTIVSGGWGMPRYGCARHSRDGTVACTNKLTIRAKVADAALLAGLRAELLRPETIAYISQRLAAALNDVIDQRPQQREELERAKASARERLQNLIAAVEAGAGTPLVFQTIKDRETELRMLENRLAALDEPLRHRLEVIPTWVRQQLEDLAGLLSEVPERAKPEFQRLGIGFTLRPIYDEGSRPFLRAEGSGDFEQLAFSRQTALRTIRSADRVSEAQSRNPFAQSFAPFPEQNGQRSTTGLSNLR